MKKLNIILLATLLLAPKIFFAQGLPIAPKACDSTLEEDIARAYLAAKDDTSDAARELLAQSYGAPLSISNVTIVENGVERNIMLVTAIDTFPEISSVSPGMSWPNADRGCPTLMVAIRDEKANRGDIVIRLIYQKE